jgi:hypothetical protein
MKVKIMLVSIILFAVSGCATSFKSPLMNAASKGDIETAQKLIKDGADINERNRSGLTPLMMAIEYGKPDAAKVFIQMGADIESKDKSGYTALTYAVLWNKIEIVKLLIEKHANVNVCDSSGETPIMLAASHGYQSIVELLIDKVADVNAKNNYGMTALHYWAWYGPAKSENTIKILIERGADASIKDYYGQTPLKYAIASKNIDAVALIRTVYQDNDETRLSLDDALRVPSRINPEQGTFSIPAGKEKAYTNAIYDCNEIIIPYKKGLLFGTGPIGYGAALAIDAVTTQGKFQRCMEKMGFKCVNNCAK